MEEVGSGSIQRKCVVCRRLLKPWTYFRENPFATLKIRSFMNCGISITWMHACDREILRLDLEQITRSRNIYNASTQFTIRLRLLIQNDSLFKGQIVRVCTLLENHYPECYTLLGGACICLAEIKSAPPTGSDWPFAWRILFLIGSERPQESLIKLNPLLLIFSSSSNLRCPNVSWAEK